MIQHHKYIEKDDFFNIKDIEVTINGEVIKGKKITLSFGQETSYFKSKVNYYRNMFLNYKFEKIMMVDNSFLGDLIWDNTVVATLFDPDMYFVIEIMDDKVLNIYRSLTNPKLIGYERPS